MILNKYFCSQSCIFLLFSLFMHKNWNICYKNGMCCHFCMPCVSRWSMPCVPKYGIEWGDSLVMSLLFLQKNWHWLLYSLQWIDKTAIISSMSFYSHPTPKYKFRVRRHVFLARYNAMLNWHYKEKMRLYQIKTILF